MQELHMLFWGGLILGGLGAVAMLVTGIFLMVRAFQTSLGWGLVYLLIPFFGPLIFVIGKWDRAAKPFLGFMASVAVASGGGVMLVMDKGVETFQESHETENPFKPEPDSTPAPPAAP